jgi:hypothetical protein
MDDVLEAAMPEEFRERRRLRANPEVEAQVAQERQPLTIAS